MANPTGRRKVSMPILLAAGVSSLTLALGMTPSFAAFTASVNNSINNAGTGTLVMQESNSAGTVTCLSTDGGGISSNVATCSTINKYGGNLSLIANGSSVTVANIRNLGTVDASQFVLTPGACVQSAQAGGSGTATDLCSKITITIASGSLTVFSGSAASFGAGGPIDVLAKLGLAKLTAGSQAGFTVTAKIDASVGNTYQGLQISQPMTWAFAS